MIIRPLLAGASALVLALAIPLAAQDSAAPVTLAGQTTGTPDERAAAMLAQLTQDEKLGLLMGYFGESFPPAGYTMLPGARPGSATCVRVGSPSGPCHM